MYTLVCVHVCVCECVQQIYEMCTSFRLGKERKSTSKSAASIYIEETESTRVC